MLVLARTLGDAIVKTDSHKKIEGSAHVLTYESLIDVLTMPASRRPE